MEGSGAPTEGRWEGLGRLLRVSGRVLVIY